VDVTQVTEATRPGTGAGSEDGTQVPKPMRDRGTELSQALCVSDVDQMWTRSHFSADHAVSSLAEKGG
jgi:hypothetical protein